MDKIADRGCYVVDTTCGDVMKVWRRVRGYAKDGLDESIKSITALDFMVGLGYRM